MKEPLLPSITSNDVPQTKPPWAFSSLEGVLITLVATEP